MNSPETHDDDGFDFSKENHFLIVFRGYGNSFYVPELESCAKLFGIEIDVQRPSDGNRPWALVHFPGGEGDVRRIFERSLQVDFALEVWAHGDALGESLTAKLGTDSVRAKVAARGAETSFRLSFESFGAKYSDSQIKEAFWCFGESRLEGPIRLRGFDDEYALFCEHHEPSKLHGGPRTPLRSVWGGRVVGRNRNTGLCLRFSVKTRPYIGTTSMSAHWSFLMAAQALVRPGALCLDPCMGTGSIALACAYYGGVVVGGDIDRQAVEGKDVGPTNRNILRRAGAEELARLRRRRGAALNFDHYRLPLGGAMLLDLAHLPFRGEGFLDAVVCDPPYGVRAGAKKVGPKDAEDPEKREARRRQECAGEVARPRPLTVRYEVDEVCRDLLGLAARLLRPGGRCVYWLPTSNVFVPERDIPSYDGLRLVCFSSDQLTRKTFRRLITMEKNYF